jgi:hypothetical protein
MRLVGLLLVLWPAAAAAASGAGSSLDEEFAPPLQLQEGQPLPGIPTTWALNQSVPEVRG